MCCSAVNDGSCSPWVMCSCSVVRGNQIRDNCSHLQHARISLNCVHMMPLYTYRMEIKSAGQWPSSPFCDLMREAISSQPH